MNPQSSYFDEEEKPIRLSWLCCHFVGSAYWQNTEIYEPDECGMEFETEDMWENWKAKCCNAICPSCGAELTQLHDGPELVKGD